MPARSGCQRSGARSGAAEASAQRWRSGGGAAARAAEASAQRRRSGGARPRRVKFYAFCPPRSLGANAQECISHRNIVFRGFFYLDTEIFTHRNIFFRHTLSVGKLGRFLNRINLQSVSEKSPADFRTLPSTRQPQSLQESTNGRCL